MKSNGPSDLPDLEQDLPTTEEDMRILRQLREPAPLAPNWLDQLTRLSEQFPGDVTSRRTFEGFEPFEL
jgi:hypothetical protein